LPDEENPVNEALIASANALADATDSDVLLYSGNIERPYDDKLLDEISAAKRRANATLILCTSGGNPNAAYRMARAFQENYKTFTVVVAGFCKSSGTLLVVGAHELVMTPHAELGPLDIQLRKKDELVGLDSGLTVLDALSQIEEQAFQLFETSMLRIVQSSEGSITFKTATHIATELSKGLVTPILAQIDPMHVGEASRALKIGEAYGLRLVELSENLRPRALKRLVHDYPSHDHVIDRREASELFLNVRDASDLERALLNQMEGAERYPKREPMIGFLSQSRKEESNDTDNAQDDRFTDHEATAEGADVEAAS